MFLVTPVCFINIINESELIICVFTKDNQNLDYSWFLLLMRPHEKGHVKKMDFIQLKILIFWYLISAKLNHEIQLKSTDLLK